MLVETRPLASRTQLVLVVVFSTNSAATVEQPSVQQASPSPGFDAEVECCNTVSEASITRLNSLVMSSPNKIGVVSLGTTSVCSWQRKPHLRPRLCLFTSRKNEVYCRSD